MENCDLLGELPFRAETGVQESSWTEKDSKQLVFNSRSNIRNRVLRHSLSSTRVIRFSASCSPLQPKVATEFASHFEFKRNPSVWLISSAKKKPAGETFLHYQIMAVCVIVKNPRT